ncbi:MAG: NAD(P)-dependent oxidoreductase [Alphaproteobacteria bacterium]|nr:NAD(P)-dependent oxidoreductase [Alphaproteobacteria bacterium]
MTEPAKPLSEFTPPSRIGFIGLGNMGAPMAALLHEAGYALVVADADAGAVSRFAERVACDQPGSLSELGEHCQAVITMLPGGEAVREVLLGDGGVAAGLQPGAVVIDMSSSSPVGTRKLAIDLAGRHIELVDAPVSGGVRKAVDGTLAIMAGGDPAVIERVRRLLEVMGKVFLTGVQGSGHAMKALNNYLSAGTLTLTAEAILAGTRFGLDARTMVDILNVSTGRSNSTEYKYPTFVLPRRFDSGFAMGLLAKDLRLAVEVAGATGSPSALLLELSGVWDAAEARMGSAADHTEVVIYLESLLEERT